MSAIVINELTLETWEHANKPDRQQCDIFASLTEKEREVLYHLPQGKPNKLIVQSSIWNKLRSSHIYGTQGMSAQTRKDRVAGRLLTSAIKKKVNWRKAKGRPALYRD